MADSSDTNYLPMEPLGEAVARDLFDRHYPRVFSFFTRLGFPREDSKDLAQETFLRAFSGAGRFRHESPFTTWLLLIARNVAVSRRRQAMAAKRQHVDVPLSADDLGWSWVVPSLASASQDPLEEAMSRERFEALQKALHELPAQMRRCLLLRVERGLKYEEIAQVLGISTGTVKAHLFQARLRLREGLAGQFSGIEDLG